MSLILDIGQFVINRTENIIVMLCTEATKGGGFTFTYSFKRDFRWRRDFELQAGHYYVALLAQAT